MPLMWDLIEGRESHINEWRRDIRRRLAAYGCVFENPKTINSRV